jgi:tetratricopeptide (TPR) repeat protein
MFDKLKAIIGSKERAPIVVTNVEEHNSVYKRGCELIKGRLILDNRFPKLSASDVADVQEAIRCFQAVVVFHTSNWNAYWIMGKSYQVLKDHRGAYQSFKSAYAICKTNANVAREFADSCLELGYGLEAVTLAMAAVETNPDDAGLHANLALAYLIAGENSYAQRAIEYALKMQPDDKISMRLKKAINDVVAGQRPQPQKMSDL